jgi:hypothetical protein
MVMAKLALYTRLETNSVQKCWSSDDPRDALCKFGARISNRCGRRRRHNLQISPLPMALDTGACHRPAEPWPLEAPSSGNCPNSAGAREPAGSPQGCGAYTAARPPDGQRLMAKD